MKDVLRTPRTNKPEQGQRELNSENPLQSKYIVAIPNALHDFTLLFRDAFLLWQYLHFDLTFIIYYIKYNLVYLYG